MTAPLFAALSCDDCKKWLHNEDGSRVEKGRYPLRMAVPRPAGMLTPCYRCPKIPHDAPEKRRKYAIELSDRNWQAWRHYRECVAVGQFPDDDIVRRHAALLRQLLDGLAEAKAEQRHNSLLQLLAMATMSSAAPGVRIRG